MKDRVRRLSVLAATLALGITTALAAENNSANAGNKGSDQTNPGAPSDQSKNAKKSRDYIDYTAMNRQSEKIGTVEVIWDDASGQPVYLGIKQQDSDKLLIAPAEKAQINHKQKNVRLSLSSETLKAAPKLEKDADLDEQTRRKVVTFYSGDRDQQQAAQAAQARSSSGEPQQQDEATIRLMEEQASVDKRIVEAGGVVLRKVVRTETQTDPITLKREELTIEREPGEGQELSEDAHFSERDIYIPLRREVPVVDKKTVLKETVRVGKDVQEQQRDIATELREEELKIEKQGQAAGAAGSVSSGSGSGSEGSTDQKASKPEQK